VIIRKEGGLVILIGLVEGCSACSISRVITGNLAQPQEAREDKFANGNVEDRKMGTEHKWTCRVGVPADVRSRIAVCACLS
jgi:hypothetical protein